jgi:DNA invertase Pin-like site-specific DNA recombinase
MTSVQAMAAQYKGDAGTLSRMAGDVEDNAKYLADLESKRPKFGSMSDGGEKQSSAKTVDEMLKGVKSTAERIRIRERWNAEHDNK